MEELYKEILYETLHNIGREDEDLGDEVLFNYLQESFKFSIDKHASLLDEARSKEAPEICLNVEVIEAKDLKSMDPNGQADPFVTLYVESKPNQRYNTSVKSGTLTPKWEEHFSLPIPDDPNSENLMIEVWDFDPAETIKEKVNKVFDVKGVKGIRRLIKEIAVTSYAGNHKNELIGKTYVPLKTIPASGIVMWYSLDKKGKTKRTGLLKLRINFSSEKNVQVRLITANQLLSKTNFTGSNAGTSAFAQDFAASRVGKVPSGTVLVGGKVFRRSGCHFDATRRSKWSQSDSNCPSKVVGVL